MQIEKIARTSYYDEIILREKDLSDHEYQSLAKEVIAICKAHDKPLLLHNYKDVAIALSYRKIHVPLPILAAMTKAEKSAFEKIGTSIHSLEQLYEAERLGADYVTASHIFPTDCKKDIPPKGIDFLREICEHSTLPVYALGGIDPAKESYLIGTGCAGCCHMSYSMQF